MLQNQTVEPGTFALLNRLMTIPELHEFHLVGGTALSLMYGHRISDDLDLFSNHSFENESIIRGLKKVFGNGFVYEQKQPRFGVFCYIDKVKVDLVRHPHSLIKQPRTIQSIRFFSTEDITAMKVQAILGRGKKKDFWDIAELLQHYSVSDFIRFHKEKYPTQNLLISIPQALTFFADAEDGPDPISLKGQTWYSVQKAINSKVREYLV